MEDPSLIESSATATIDAPIEGEGIIYVLEGTLEYQVDGRPTATYKAGDVLIVPAGAIHTVKNVGSGSGADLAMYVVKKGKTLIPLAR